MKFEKLTHFARGFVYAYNGIRAAIREEQHFRFHLCAALYAFVQPTGRSCLRWKQP